MGDRMATTAAARRKVGADANGMELRVKGRTDAAFRGYSARAAAAFMRIVDDKANNSGWRSWSLLVVRLWQPGGVNKTAMHHQFGNFWDAFLPAAAGKLWQCLAWHGIL